MNIQSIARVNFKQQSFNVLQEKLNLVNVRNNLQLSFTANRILARLRNHTLKANDDIKGPVKLINRVKIAHSFLHYVSNQFHIIILSLPM